MKKGIRYLRFSHEGQSNSSIEWQDMYTKEWCDRNNIQIVDTFIDAGHSAKTFDRPDFEKLYKFISKHNRSVDFLIVNQLDRFSRDTGEGLSLVKKLQMKYSIQIVSVTEGITFDYHTPGSFFRTGLQLLLAEEDNINRAQKINAGIYTAKAKEGRWIQGGPAPYGYRKEGNGKNRHLVIEDEQAEVIRYIYDAYLRNTPFYVIMERAKEMGLKRTSSSAIQEILTAPLYSGQQYVKPWKNLPGGIFPAKHEAIIDIVTWQAVQDKISSPKTKISLSDEIPLRGVLKCHCGKLLTGAPSRGRSQYYYYYKCQTAGHNNLSANKAHTQLLEILGYMSLPEHLAFAIEERSEQLLDKQMKDNKKVLQQKKKEYSDLEEQLISIEEKWIKNQMSFETYNRWYNSLTQRRVGLRATMDKLSQDHSEVYKLLQQQLYRLTDLQYIYKSANTPQKQELIRMGFDNGLYYQDGVYRTSSIMSVFAHNELILSQKQLLVIDGKEKTGLEVRSGGGDRSIIEPLTDFLSFIRTIRVA